MIYLLDANVLITAKNTYYPLERVPEFWSWLIYMGEQNNIKIVKEIYDELKDGNDELVKWIKKSDVEHALLFDETVDISQVRNVLKNGYADDLTDDEIEKIGQDPFLISYGLTDIENRTIVTTEVSRPKRKRDNRHVPDVCNDFNIQCINTFRLTQILDFKTGWFTERN